MPNAPQLTGGLVGTLTIFCYPVRSSGYLHLDGPMILVLLPHRDGQELRGQPEGKRAERQGETQRKTMGRLGRGWSSRRELEQRGKW